MYDVQLDRNLAHGTICAPRLQSDEAKGRKCIHPTENNRQIHQSILYSSLYSSLADQCGRLPGGALFIDPREL